MRWKSMSERRVGHALRQTVCESLLRQAPGLMASAALVVLLSACGGEGAGAGGSLIGIGQTAPNTSIPVTGTAEVTVTAAVPVSGAGRVITTTGTVGGSVTAGLTGALISGQTADGAVQHRFLVEFEPVSGAVQSVTHAWGASVDAPDAIVKCARIQTNPSVTVQLCGDTVRVVPSTGQITFASAPLRSGSFQSVLNGVVSFTIF